jgi:hypothetical protein
MKTKTYRAEFFTAADYAVRSFQATTPSQALQLARQFYEDNLIELDFRSYDDNAGLNQIEVWDTAGGARATWESEDYRLRQAAPELFTALQAQTQAAKAVVANWEKGDLAAAVRALDAAIPTASAAITKAQNRGSLCFLKTNFARFTAAQSMATSSPSSTMTEAKASRTTPRTSLPISRQNSISRVTA